MLVRFSLENWMSFRDEASFTMTATSERQHGERIPRVAKYPIRILPIAALYGGNASGKTNLFQSLNFVRRMILRGTVPDRPIPVVPFQLNPASEQPSRFVLALLIDETIYEYSFAVSRQQVLEERLVEIRSTSEKVLYHRHADRIRFHKSLQKDQFLVFAFRGTRANQLFLTNAISQKVNNFRPIYDWFDLSLVMAAPDARFASIQRFPDEDHFHHARMNEILPRLDTGITRLGSENISLELLSKSLMSELQAHLKEGETVLITPEFVVTRKQGELMGKKLATYHAGDDGTEVRFDIDQEADGTKRAIDLLPALLELGAAGSKKVYVIDEIDRSLHPLLTRKLLEAYLDTCTQGSRAQLLLTTHDLLLMDQRLLRRDEMWVTERDASGVSHLIPFSDYRETRYDKDIRKSYLQGRMGGLPQLGLEGEDLMSPATKAKGSTA